MLAALLRLNEEEGEEEVLGGGGRGVGEGVGRGGGREEEEEWLWRWKRQNVRRKWRLCASLIYLPHAGLPLERFSGGNQPDNSLFCCVVSSRGVQRLVVCILFSFFFHHRHLSFRTSTGCLLSSSAAAFSQITWKSGLKVNTPHFKKRLEVSPLFQRSRVFVWFTERKKQQQKKTTKQKKNKTRLHFFFSCQRRSFAVCAVWLRRGGITVAESRLNKRWTDSHPLNVFVRLNAENWE